MKQNGLWSNAPASGGKRLLILRPDNLGDLVLFSGALKHLRRLWPAAHITLCVRSFGLDLFAHCPFVDELMPYENCYMDVWGQGRYSWMPKIRGCDQLGAWLRKHAPGIARLPYRCDTAILPVLAPTLEQHQCMKMIPARNKIGIYGNRCNQPVQVEAEFRDQYSAQMDASWLAWNFPETEATCLFLKFLGSEVQASELWPEYWTTNEDRRKAKELMPERAGEITLGIAPGFSNPLKKLASGWFAKVVDLLAMGDSQIVLFGSSTEVGICTEVAQAIENSGNNAKVVNLAGRTSVRELVECIRRCSIILSQDTAVLHIATALRKPVAGIIGGGHYGRFYPWGDPELSRAVNKPMDCYGCNWQCKYETVRCIQEISPADAAGALNDLLAMISRR